MSQVQTDKISNVVGTRPPAVEKADFVKVWGFIDADVNGAPALASFGISSTVDAAVGQYGINFTNQFNAANYGIGACSAGNSTNALIINYGGVAATGISFFISNTFAGARGDPFDIGFQISGVLA